jgi:hypothetical protein
MAIVSMAVSGTRAVFTRIVREREGEIFIDSDTPAPRQPPPVIGNLIYRSKQAIDAGRACQICLLDFAEEDPQGNYVIETPCADGSAAEPHLFCQTCLETWLYKRRECPTCRQVVDLMHRTLPDDHPHAQCRLRRN